MNEKKILIVNKEQNYVLESEIKKLLKSVGIGADRFVLSPDSPHGYGDWVSPYAASLVLYSHAKKELGQNADYSLRRLNTTFGHGMVSGAFGARNVGVLYLPDSDPCIRMTGFAIEAGADGVWKIKLLNQLINLGFEIDEAKFVELAKSV